MRLDRRVGANIRAKLYFYISNGERSITRRPIDGEMRDHLPAPPFAHRSAVSGSSPFWILENTISSERNERERKRERES